MRCGIVNHSRDSPALAGRGRREAPGEGTIRESVPVERAPTLSPKERGEGEESSPQQLIEPVAQLVLVIGLCQPRQVGLGAVGQFGIAGGEQDRQ